MGFLATHRSLLSPPFETEESLFPFRWKFYGHDEPSIVVSVLLDAAEHASDVGEQAIALSLIERAKSAGSDVFPVRLARTKAIALARSGALRAAFTILEPLASAGDMAA